MHCLQASKPYVTVNENPVTIREVNRHRNAIMGVAVEGGEGSGRVSGDERTMRARYED